MEKKWIVDTCMDVFATCEGNTINEADKSFIMFDAPLVGVASAADALFEEYKKP